MSVLTGDRITERLKAGTSGLIITPILSPKQIGASSVDLRLGNQFIVFRMHMLETLQPFNTPNSDLKKMQQRQVVRFGSPFVLHPGMLALGSTFEYIRLRMIYRGKLRAGRHGPVSGFRLLQQRVLSRVSREC